MGTVTYDGFVNKVPDLFFLPDGFDSILMSFSGKLRDVTGSYDMSFRTCGAFFILASILIFCEQFPLKHQKRHKRIDGSEDEK